MYQQSLYKILEEHINPKVVKRLNKSKKWEYGYNKEHDVVVISKDGTIGEIYEIQNLKIALPKEKDVYKFKNNKWSKFEYPKALTRIKQFLTGNNIQKILKKNGMITSIMNLPVGRKVFGFITKAFYLH